MWLALIPLFLQVLTQLPALIQTAEVAFSGKPGNGPAKKKLVTDSASVIIDTYQSVGKKKIPTEDVTLFKDTVASMVDSTVAAINLVKGSEAKGVSFLDPEPKV